MAIPSGPFEATLTAISSSPYSIAAAIFLLNIGGRFLPFEVTKEQEKFLNQPIFRRLIIFVIFFVATRNIIIAAMLAFICILCIGYLFNENSSLCLFGKGGEPGATCKTKGLAETIALTPEEQQMLKTLTEKADKVKKSNEGKFELGKVSSAKIHTQYETVLRNLYSN